MHGANVLSDHLQVTVATMTGNCKRAVRGMSTDLSKFSKGRIQEVELKESQGPFQLKYACLKSKRTRSGTLDGS